jgi:hypothetical protein
VTGTDPCAGQEAARLLAAAQGWLRTSAPHLAPVSADGEPCSCPLCRAVVGLREADPESVGRWVDSAVSALSSLVAQAGDLAAAAGAGEAENDAGAEDDAQDDEPDTAGEADAEARHDAGAQDEDEAQERLARQEDPAPRGVRRIPLDRTVDDPEGHPR